MFWFFLLQSHLLSLCLNLVSIVIPLLTPVPLSFPSTSPVSGVLDSHYSDQWAPVVLGSLPLLNHQSCTNLHNSPSQAQPHQSYPRRMGTLSNTHPYIFTTVPGVWRLEVCPLCWLPELNVTDCDPVLLAAVSSSYSWHLQDANSLIGTLSPSDFAEVRPPQACESVLFYCSKRDKCATWRTSSGSYVIMHASASRWTLSLLIDWIIVNLQEYIMPGLTCIWPLWNSINQWQKCNKINIFYHFSWQNI